MKKKVLVSVISLVVAGCIVAIGNSAQDSRPHVEFEITPAIERMLDAISPDSLRENLTYIASDDLGGRDTPSPGLDLAAMYIAEQFAKAGLKPVGDDGYFQTANWHLSQPSVQTFRLLIETGSEVFDIPLNRISTQPGGVIDLEGVGLYKIDFEDTETLEELSADEVGGKVVLSEVPNFRRVERSKMREIFMASRVFMRRMAELDAVAVLSVNRESSRGSGFGRPTLIDPEKPFPRTGLPSGVPTVTVHHDRIVALYDDSAPGPVESSVTLRVGASEKTPVRLRNVIGLLPGSDPVLRDTYVMVTGHYDHLGTREEMADGEDKIFNGANDDGSGTVSVIELAHALSRLEPRPRRSIIFMCVFGEERGLLGSRYYGRNPIFPIESTVADVNLEQVGRTDSTEGPQMRNASMTGYDFSEMGEIFTAAGKLTGIEVYKHEVNSDAYFGRSDNQALADLGVPAHTICVAYDYADYHGPGDHSDKIDYENMAAVNRMVALGILMIAQSDREPAWNKENPKAARYLNAWRERRGIDPEAD